MSDLDQRPTAGLDRRQLIKGAVAGAGALALPGVPWRRPRRAGAARCVWRFPTILPPSIR